MREKLLLIQINWVFGEEPLEFQRCASFVANLFTYKLPLVICKGTSKVNIDFTTYPNMEGISECDSILHITELFSAEGFEERNLAGKMALLVTETYKALILVYQYLNLDVAQLDIGYKKIRDDQYQLIRTLINGQKLNKSRTTTAVVIAEYFLDSTEIKVNFHNKKSETINSVPLFKTRPGVLFYNGLLMASKWIDNKTFELTNKTREINFRITADGQVTMHYQPINRDIDGVKEEIVFFTSERSFEL
jgi:hypothetical protein